MLNFLAASRFEWVSMTPFGTPVVPLEKKTEATSSLIRMIGTLKMPFFPWAISSCQSNPLRATNWDFKAPSNFLAKWSSPIHILIGLVILTTCFNSSKWFYKKYFRKEIKDIWQKLLIVWAGLTNTAVAPQSWTAMQAIGYSKHSGKAMATRSPLVSLNLSWSPVAKAWVARTISE